MATKTHSGGTTLGYDTDGTPPYTDIADLVRIKPPPRKRGKVKTTSIADANKVHSYIPGWREAGEIEFVGHFTKTQFATLNGFFDNETIYYWKVEFPFISGESTTHSNLVCQGFISEIDFDEITEGQDETVHVPFKVQITGLVTFTAGS